MRSFPITLTVALCLVGVLAPTAQAQVMAPLAGITVAATPPIIAFGDVRGGTSVESEFQVIPYGQNASATVTGYSLETPLPKGHRVEFLDSSTCTGATLTVGAPDQAVPVVAGTPCTVRFRWVVPTVAASAQSSWGEETASIRVAVSGSSIPYAGVQARMNAVKPFVFGPTFTMAFATPDLKLTTVKRAKRVRFVNHGLPSGVGVPVKGQVLLGAKRARAFGMTVRGTAPVVLGSKAATTTRQSASYAITLNVRGRHAVALALRKRVSLLVAVKLQAQDRATGIWHTGQMPATLGG